MSKVNFSNFETKAAFDAIQGNREDAQHWEEVSTDDGVTVALLAEKLIEWHLHLIELNELGGFQRTVVYTAISRVDWEQLATAIQREALRALAQYEQQ